MAQPESTPTPIFKLDNHATSAVVMVDPETATEWLGHNDSNRSLRQHRITQYARDMVKGEWHMTGEPIKFAADGTLLDGQHRLHAIRRARMAVPMLVVRGLHSDAQSYMDTGAARTAGDALALRGEPHANTLAAVAKLAIAVDRGNRTGMKMSPSSHAEVFDWIDDNPAVRDAVAYGHSRYSRTGPLTATTLAYCYFRLAVVDQQAAVEFLDGVASGANLPVGSPQLAVRDRVFKTREDQKAVRNIDIVSMVFRAWNTWRKGRTIKSVLLPQPGSEVPRPR